MRWSTWVILLLGGLAAPAPAQEALAWKFKEGASFTLERSHRQKQTVELKGTTRTQELTTIWVSRLDVRKVGDGEFVLDQTIVSVAVKDAVPDLKPPAWTEKIAGNTFRVTLSPAGRIRKFEGYEEFIMKLDAPRLEQSIRHLLPEATLRESLEEMLGFLPEKPVRPGTVWQREAVEPIAPFGSVKSVFDYTLAGPEDGPAKITCTVRASYVPPQKDLGVLRVVQGDLKAEHGKGAVLFDAKKGLLIHGKQQVRIRGTLTLETAPRQTDELTFVSESWLTWRLTDLKR